MDINHSYKLVSEHIYYNNRRKTCIKPMVPKTGTRFAPEIHKRACIVAGDLNHRSNESKMRKAIESFSIKGDMRKRKVSKLILALV
jgi:hypothetical protein